MKNKEIKQYIIDKDNFDRIQGYLVEIEQKANELAGKYEKYEKGNNNDFERFFDTLATAGMFLEQTEADSEKVYYDNTELVKIDESQCITDKYNILTCEKEDSLGTNTTLKELMDLWWNRIDIYKGDKYIGCCYKTCENDYYFDFMSDKKKFDLKQWLIKKVVVDNYSDTDSDGYPIVNCWLD